MYFIFIQYDIYWLLKISEGNVQNNWKNNFLR